MAAVPAGNWVRMHFEDRVRAYSSGEDQKVEEADQGPGIGEDLEEDHSVACSMDLEDQSSRRVSEEDNHAETSYLVQDDSNFQQRESIPEWPFQT